jgi:hypothetical protein
MSIREALQDALEAHKNGSVNSYGAHYRDRAEIAAEKALAALERVYEIERQRQEADIREAAKSDVAGSAVQEAREASSQARVAADACRECLNRVIEQKAEVTALVTRNEALMDTFNQRYQEITDEINQLALKVQQGIINIPHQPE